MDDVDAISWGKKAKKKGTGSRGVPHRLNDEERKMFDFARKKGFVEIAGSGWRRQRSDAPLVNTYRSWCDACAHPAIFLHKGTDYDNVVVDLSPLRTPLLFEKAAAFCLENAPDGTAGFDSFDGEGGGSEDLVNACLKRPIYQVPAFNVVWARPRAEAKVLAKGLAARLGIDQQKSKGRKKVSGAPNRKPGKSRRHGGYGIGGKSFSHEQIIISDDELGFPGDELQGGLEVDPYASYDEWQGDESQD
jgi:hypothetical protein